MKKKILIPAFLIMILAQWYFPAKMIFNKEDVIATGKEFLFKTAPVDPNDPFRGKYIDLSFEATTYQVKSAGDWKTADPVYVTLIENDQGFAKIQDVSKEKPGEGEIFVKAKIGFFVDDSLRNMTIEYPFTRFYMEESKAYAAEQAYLESTRDSTQVTYALVSVKNGDAVIKDVIINGVPINEAAKNWKDTQD